MVSAKVSGQINSTLQLKKTNFSVVNQTSIECNDSHQKLMNDDFHLCVTEYTQDYYAYRCFFQLLLSIPVSN